MAAIKFRFRTLKLGVKCTGKVRLACGKDIEEFALGRTEEMAKTVCERLIRQRIAHHVDNCSEAH